MGNIIIQMIPFCYGPTSIAIAIAHKIRELSNNSLYAIAGSPSIELIQHEGELFESIISLEELDNHYASKVLEDSDLIVSICDFDFVHLVKKKYPDKKVAIVDPLFWMWDSMPDAVNFCDFYFALDFPGVKERALQLSYNKVQVVPQVARFQFTHKGNNLSKELNVIVNFGGMLSPFGANFDLAEAMCIEILNAAYNCSFTAKIKIRTSQSAAIELRKRLPSNKVVSIGSSTQSFFQRELLDCNFLMTVPGMSIIYESFLGSVPTYFLLPLNYSQHLQIKKYNNMFINLSGIRWDDFPDYFELPEGLSEDEGVKSAQDHGSRFLVDKESRKIFYETMLSLFQNETNVVPLSSKELIDVSGDLMIANALINHD